MAEELAVVDSIKESWDPFKDNLALTFGIPLVMTLVPTIVVVLPIGGLAFVIGLGSALADKSAASGAAMLMLLPLALVGAVLFAIVYGAIRVGWTKICLALVRGESASFGDLKAGLAWMMPFVITMLIVGVATAIGACLFVIPGIFIAVRTAFAPFLVIDQNLGPVDAIKKSNEMVTGISWQILLYLVLYGAANVVTGLVPIVSIVAPFAVMGIFDIALAKIYLSRAK